MNLALLIKQPVLKKYLLKQLAYFANGWYVFEEQTAKPEPLDANKITFKAVNSSTAKLIVVAKAHYQETWQSYSSVSKKELKQIIALQKSNENPVATTFNIVENSTIDGFDVKKISFDEQLINDLGEQRILIPETELFQQVNSKPQVLSLMTPVGHLFASFFSDKSTSAYAKGLVANIETFKLSSGIPIEAENIHIDDVNYANFLFSQLIKQKIDVLFKKSAFNARTWFKVKDLHILYWAPLLTASLFYLASNSFLWFKGYSIESSLAAQSDEVKQLLSNKQKQDQQSNLLKLLNAEFSKTATVHHHWSIVYSLVESGMVIDRLTFSGNALEVRGKADKASLVLREISNSPLVASASFARAARKSRGQELFTLAITPALVVSTNQLDISEEPPELDKEKINNEG